MDAMKELTDRDITDHLQTRYCCECPVQGPEALACHYRDNDQPYGGTQCPVQKAIDALQ